MCRYINTKVKWSDPENEIEFEAPPYLLTHTDGSWLNGTYEATKGE